MKTKRRDRLTTKGANDIANYVHIECMASAECCSCGNWSEEEPCGTDFTEARKFSAEGLYRLGWRVRIIDDCLGLVCPECRGKKRG